MPQEIPLRSSETLDFTPQSLAGIADAPVFVLRAATRDDKRYQRRLSNRRGISQHSPADMRTLGTSA